MESYQSEKARTPNLRHMIIMGSKKNGAEKESGIFEWDLKSKKSACEYCLKEGDRDWDEKSDHPGVFFLFDHTHTHTYSSLMFHSWDF